MPNPDYPTWGGPRPGAGRPPLERVRITCTVSGTTARLLREESVNLATKFDLKRPRLGAAVDKFVAMAHNRDNKPDDEIR